MKHATAALLLLGLAAGCAFRAHPAALPALDREGALYLYALPWPAEARRLAFTVTGLSAQRDDGTEVPLEVVLPEQRAPATERQRLLAWGRLPPGSYGGLLLRVGAASLATAEGGAAALLVSPEPARLQLPFRVAAGRALVASLELRGSDAVGPGFTFQPGLAATLPPPAPPQRLGWVSNGGSAALTVLDRGTRRGTGVLATGNGPRGLALDARSNRGYVALSAEDQLEVVDLAAGESVTRIRLHPGVTIPA